MDKRDALKGVGVIDFTWMAAGPFATKFLADHGAQVIKIESTTKTDSCRVSTPYKDGVPGLERSGIFHYFSSSKYSITLNLKHPRSWDVTRRLIAWADIIMENYAPGTLKRLGLDYENVRKLKPDIIMLGASLFGQTGPFAHHPGFGWNLNGLAGFLHFTGWPDREAVGPSLAYPDYIAPWWAVIAILSALDYKRRTGRGQYIDISQFEAGLSFLSPALLDYTANGRVQTRIGNRHPYAAPHGAYRCKGEDRWCVLAVFSDEQWEALCRVTDNLGWIKDPRFATLMARKQHEEELDQMVEAWTINYSPEEVMNRMQEAGLPAGVVKNAADLDSDPQLKAREHFQPIDHPVMGPYPYFSWPAKLSKTPAALRRAPLLGEHTEYVCCEILGMQDSEFCQLMNEGVFS